MNYQETLDYLYTQLPMFQRQGPMAMKKDLTNIRKLCAYLGNPQEQFRSIHLAGTNGKGSTAHLLSSVCQVAGLKTGLYTSPHYKDFRERIKIDGSYIPQKAVVDFVAQHKAVFEKIQPSFFEITVALAFQHFAQQKVDVAIIETGLGGRLDSTNIITPLVSVITNISPDHQQFLGDTLAEIASEKAGIIKTEIPVVIGEYQSEVADVFIQKAKAMQAALYIASHQIKVKTINESLDSTTFQIDSNKFYLPQLKANIRGPFQAKNVATTLATIHVLQKQYQFFGNINIEAPIQKGFAFLQKLTNYKGRWQVIGQHPTILCDSAHNKGGLEILFSELQKMKYNQLHFIYGTVSDKDLTDVFPLFPKEARYYFAKAAIPRGMNAKELQQKAANADLIGRAYTSVKNALRAAKRKAAPNDLIFVGGSIFVVAEVI